MSAQPFEIAEDGKAATNGAATVALADDDGRMFRRRAIRRFGSGSAEPVEWLVVQLENVRVYVDGGNVIVSRSDLWP